ncbi:protein-L-isoaspartate O-methyltransferase family protein [Actinomycetospora atypica]|uniref:Protein-L-isoaspartate O-methyltransferase n=1 Tax=Actinomycetospora atypica TaxID=1290095 RepID=A0ABV9YX85_9PSEU
MRVARADVVGAHAATGVGRFQHGVPAPQVTPPAVVLAMLRLLDLPRGGSVYEVGTGSGFATAVLARAVGPAGRVHSVDRDAAVVDRAGRLLGPDPLAGTVTVAVADALREPPPDGPYDRLVAFLSVADGPPDLWTAAVRRGGRLVVPVRGTRRVVRYRVGEPGELVAEGGITATFTG